MTKGKSFGADRVLAMMFMVSVLMLLAIPVIGNVAGRRQVATGDTPKEVAEMRARLDAEEDALGFTLNFLLVGGITGILVSLATGLVIAYGIGPSWMARRHDGMVVQDKFGDDGENKYFGQSVPNIRGVRYCVRVTLADGRPAEFFTDRETYGTIVVGQVLAARLLGRRLVKIESAERRPDG